MGVCKQWTGLLEWMDWTTGMTFDLKFSCEIGYAGKDVICGESREVKYNFVWLYECICNCFNYVNPASSPVFYNRGAHFGIY